MHPPPQFLGRERVELVMHAPIHTDYAFRLEAMLVDVMGKRINFRRPSRAITRVRPEMKKVYGGVMNVYDEKTKRRGTKKENSKSTEVFCGELCV